MKNRKAVYTKIGNLVNIYINCFDEDNQHEFSALLKFIKEISINKKTFLKSYGLERTAIGADAIIASASDLKETLKESYYLKSAKIELINEGIFDARWAIFYFFDNNVRWEDFLMTEKIDKMKPRSNIFFATIGLSDERDLVIDVNSNLDLCCNNFLNALQNFGYRIKKFTFGNKN